MALTTPAESFAEAQAAMTNGDWDGFFATLDRDDLMKIAANGVNRLVGQGPSGAAILRDLGAEHSINAEMVAELIAGVERIVSSARAAPSADHRAIVGGYEDLLKRMLKGIADPGRFAAALERTFRAAGSGGSVSSSLFVGERLEGVEIDGNRAWGTRRLAGGEVEDIGFAKRRGGWFIRLLARRPRARGLRPGGETQSPRSEDLDT
ncbi:hypothetical protein [Thiocapsa sp.]|uniref:hypothetical protein n=1 Tax=Thiocapsa sp. TaxID=2024551 RepID=UPI0026002FC9|nr:hypothetical protein [Thiocapsa sp.]